MEHFYVKFGDPSCIGFLKHRLEENRQTDTRQTKGGKNPVRKKGPETAVGVGTNKLLLRYDTIRYGIRALKS